MRLAILAALAVSAFAQTGALSPVPIQQPLENSGRILGGSCMYSYAAGTTNIQYTYLDDALMTANPDPMQLNAFGRLPAMYLLPMAYKFVFAYPVAGTCPVSPGAVIWSQDNVYDFGQHLEAALATSAGAGYIGYLSGNTYNSGTVGAELQTITTVLTGYVSVEGFGAKGDGITSDCAAFTGAIASGASLVYATGAAGSGKFYYLPCTLTLASGQAIIWGGKAPGSPIAEINGFIIPDSSTVKTAGNMALIGQGSGVTEIQQLAAANRDLIQSASFYSLFDTGNQFGVNGFTIKGVTLDGNAANQTLATKSITGASGSTPISMTVVGHGYSTGNVICQKNVGGRPEADGCFVITVTGADSYTLNNTAGLSINTYTSGGAATNGKENCLALYGIGYVFQDVAIQNCAMNGVLSGWDTEPSDAYVSPLDRIPAMFSQLTVDNNGFDGIRWHGPHDSYFASTNIFSNGDWGFANDQLTGGVQSASVHLSNMNSYGNTVGGIYDGGTIEGSEITGNALSSGWGVYIGPNGGSSSLDGLHVGGNIGIGLEVNSSSNRISGDVVWASPATLAAIKLSGGEGNLFHIGSGAVVNGLNLFSETAESNANAFIAVDSAITLSGGAALFDPANPPSAGDFVDIGAVPKGDKSAYWQQTRQLTINPVYSSDPGTIVTSNSSPTVTGSGTAFTSAMAGATITATSGSGGACFVAAVISSTSLSCLGNFSTTNATGVTYAITNLPPFVTASTGVPVNLIAHAALYFTGGGVITNAVTNAGVISLDGGSPSSGTFTFQRPFSGVLATDYMCSTGIVAAASVSYTPGMAGTSSTLTLKGPNGATDNWMVVCDGF